MFKVVENPETSELMLLGYETLDSFDGTPYSQATIEKAHGLVSTWKVAGEVRCLDAWRDEAGNHALRVNGLVRMWLPGPTVNGQMFYAGGLIAHAFSFAREHKGRATVSKIYASRDKARETAERFDGVAW